jgi:methylphosphotriester-DNA--protein-cysteine methyltransferase
VLEFEGAPVGLLLRPRPAARFRGSRSERFVCYPSCHSVRAIASEDVVEFASVAQAVAAGYETCSLCRPA